MHYIGIDAGGTKTLFALYEEQGNLLDTITLGSCHFMKVGFTQMGKILKQGVRLLLEKNGLTPEDVTLSFGLAGYGREEGVRKAIEDALCAEFAGYRYLLHNDVETALAGAFEGGDGIMLIAGTGSIAYMKHGDIHKRAGGFGYLLGDEGSAYDLSKKMLNTFTREEDGRLEKTVLYDLLMERLSLKEPYDIISFVSETLGNKRDEIAKLAPHLHEAAQLGDPEAIRIYREAALELAALANALAKDIDGEINLATFGGVFKAGEFVLNPLRNFLAENIHLIEPKYPPEYGAYLLARKSGEKS